MLVMIVFQGFGMVTGKGGGFKLNEQNVSRIAGFASLTEGWTECSKNNGFSGWHDIRVTVSVSQCSFNATQRGVKQCGSDGLESFPKHKMVKRVTSMAEQGTSTC